MKEGETDPDDVPEAPKEPSVKPGDLWQLGKQRLLCGDLNSVNDCDVIIRNWEEFTGNKAKRLQAKKVVAVGI